jgi:hypothetical protein
MTPEFESAVVKLQTNVPIDLFSRDEIAAVEVLKIEDGAEMPETTAGQVSGFLATFARGTTINKISSISLHDTCRSYIKCV